MKSGIKPNTFIGGVGATINTPALLATKLGITVSRIKGFKVAGLDVQCAIVGTYSIPFNTFLGNTQLNKYIDLDGLVTTIGNSAFNGCTSLVGDLVFNSLIDLGNAAFFGTKITGFTANNVTTIQVNAFYNCTFLVSISFNNVTTIQLNAFYNCTSLVGDLVFNSLTSLVSSSFIGTKITGFTANNLATIQTNTFSGHTFLVSISFNNVTTIGNSAFNGCTSLVGDLVFNSLIDLGNAAFFGTKITGFTANNVATIQTHTFYNCTALAQIYIINVGLIGASNTALNNVFLNIKTGCTIKVPVAMQTINAGGVEPDLQYAISTRGATVIYI